MPLYQRSAPRQKNSLPSTTAPFRTPEIANLAACLICLVTGQIVSYVKARAEGLGLSANVGIAERFERLVIIGLGGIGDGLGIPSALDVALWLLVVLSVITVAQRILHVRRLDRETP